MADAVSEFLAFLSTERSAAAGTIDAYRVDLSQFEVFARVTLGAGWWQLVDAVLVRQFTSDLRLKGYAETTIARKTLTIRSFLTYLVNRGLLAANPALDVPVPRERLSGERINASDVKRLLAPISAAASAGERRNRAMLHLLYATGMKLRELLALNIDDVTVEPDQALVRRHAKDDGGEVTIISRDAHSALADYLHEARPSLARDPGERALFLNFRGDRLTRQGFWLAMRAHAKSMDVSSEVSARRIRRTSTPSAGRMSPDRTVT